MDEVIIAGRDEERRIINRVVGAFSQPAFVRRAQQVEGAYQQLLQACQSKRHELLKIARLRLATLHALLGGDWRKLAVSETTIRWLAERFDKWQPALRMPVAASKSPRAWRRALNELAN